MNNVNDVSKQENLERHNLNTMIETNTLPHDKLPTTKEKK